MRTLRRDNKHTMTLWEKILYTIFAAYIIVLIISYLIYLLYFNTENILLILLGADFFIITLVLTWWIIPRKPRIIQFVGDPDSIFLGRPLSDEDESEEKLIFTKSSPKKTLSTSPQTTKHIPANKCAYCNQIDFLPYVCTYCRKPFCSKHRLPERHNCEQLHTKT